MERTDQKRVLNEWLNEHKSLIFKVVLAYSNNSHDHEDLFQEIALQLWKSIPKFRGKCADTTWIYRVSLNSAMAWSRKEKKHPTDRRSIDSVEHLLKHTPKSQDERLTWLYERIAQLNEIDRSLTLLMLDGYSYREMAEILGISENNVGVKINRIKKHLITERERTTTR
ncbi:MAG: sigma-70 family RNA polymerase sigma factor [Verrucomicrobiota bacterium]